PVADVGLNVIPFPHELRLDGRRARVETLASGPGDADAIGVRAQPDGGYVVETDARADAGRTADSAARSEALADRFVDAVAALVRGESPAVDVTVRRARRPGLEHVSAPAAELEPKPAPAPSPASAPVSVPRPVSVPSGAIAQGESGVGVLDRVRLRAETAPDAPAFVSIPSPNGSAESSIRPSIDLTYGELWRRALGLADRLRARGIGRDRLVGVIADRGPDHAVGALGALIAGAAFVPMPAGPGGEAERRRIAGVVRLDATFDATREPLGGAALGAVLDVTSGATPGGGLDAIVEPGERGVRPARDSNPAAAPPDSAHPGPVHPVSAHLALAHPGSAHPDQLAYVITTSGSTGAPKPVAITRGALDAWVDAILRDYLPLGPSDRVAQFAAVQFDASIEELFGALCSGAALVPRSGLALERIGDWLDECAAAGVTVLDLPTGYWHEVVVALATGTAALPSSVHTVIIGGEAASPERVRQWCELVGDAARLVNTYGPTEATVVATRHVLAGPALAGA
ncbi:MAG: AMP-binding protein, partial [Pseudoclavibacter sp.]